jgi:mycothiol synthase
VSSPALPTGYGWRRPAGGDAVAVARLLAACELADTGVGLTGEDDVRALWVRPGYAHDRDGWLVEAVAGDLVAYASLFWPKPGDSCEFTVVVHPEHRRRGLGATLLSCAERRAREAAAAAADAAAACLTERGDPLAGICVGRSADGIADSLLRRGYHRATVYIDLEADLREPPAAPRLPPGLEIRPLHRGSDEMAAFDCADEAFAEHHFVEVEDYNEWSRRTFVRRQLDTRFWLLAWHGDVVVGDALVYPGPTGPYIYELAVRPAWRGRGLGRALMLALFGALRDAGHTSAWLRVDEHNRTGAPQLYRALGMREVRTWDFFEKLLGPPASA